MCIRDRIYAVCMDKSIALFNIGSRPLEEGMNILGAHIDSPRIDAVSYTHLDVYKRQIIGS